MKKYYFYKNEEDKIILAGVTPLILTEIIIEEEDPLTLREALELAAVKQSYVARYLQWEQILPIFLTGKNFMKQYRIIT